MDDFDETIKQIRIAIFDLEQIGAVGDSLRARSSRSLATRRPRRGTARWPLDGPYVYVSPRGPNPLSAIPYVSTGSASGLLASSSVRAGAPASCVISHRPEHRRWWRRTR